MKRILFLATIAVAAVRTIGAHGDEPKPNIVFILLDNCGKEWFGCYGSEENCTPRIDRLAAEGVKFENCYTPPVCGPSRITLLTGRYLLRSGMTLHHDAALYSGGGLSPEREVVFARPLRQAGYATGVVGKWQINNLYDEPDVLVQHGFDEHVVWPGSIDRDRVQGDEWSAYRAAVDARSVEGTRRMMPMVESRYWNPVIIRSGRREVDPGKFGPDVLQHAALDFLRRHREHPFLLYYPMVLTHGQSFVEHVVATPANRDTNRPIKDQYADMLRYADRLVGEVVDELEKLGLREQTIVFVATDNGTEKHIAARFRGREVQGALYTLTEPGANVPLLDFSDILPTLCELAGASLPAGVTLDGVSQAAVIRGVKGASPPRQWIFDQYADKRIVRDQRYKLWSDGSFYDLHDDPEESRDLRGSSDPRMVVARQKLQRVLDRLPPDAEPPFELLSQSAFQLRAERQAKPKP